MSNPEQPNKSEPSLLWFFINVHAPSTVNPNVPIIRNEIVPLIGDRWMTYINSHNYMLAKGSGLFVTSCDVPLVDGMEDNGQNSGSSYITLIILHLTLHKS